MIDLFLSTWYLWILLIILAAVSLFKPRIKGFIGEKTVAAFLSTLDSNKYKTINDVIVEVEGKTSQIDHIVISNYGIFVIETKNYKGHIYGDDHNQYWTQTLGQNTKKFYSPIRQNYSHIQALKQHLLDYPGFRIISIIVFSPEADLRVKTTQNVIYTTKLLKTIRKYTDETIPHKIRDEVYNRIMSLNISSNEGKKEHISAIHQNKKEVMKNISNGICPRCGGVLARKKGKYGYFKGCSNYPKCDFTINI